MVLQNAFGNLALDATMQAILTELNQKLEAGQAVALDAPTLAALETITATISNLPADYPDALATTRLTAILAALSSVAVTGPLTDAQLRATAVPVSGTVAVTGPLTDTQLRAAVVPVSLDSTTVTGSVAVTGPLTNTQAAALGLALDTTSAAIRDLLITLRDNQYRRTDPLPVGSNTIGHVTTSLQAVTVLNLASAARTVTGTSGPFDVSPLSRIAFDANITAVTGVTPSMLLILDRQGADGIWYPMYTSSAINTSRTVSTSIGQGMTVAQGLGTSLRLRWEITGTAPSFTFSASLVGK